MNWINKEIQLLMYSTPTTDIIIEAIVKDETLRLTQKSMSKLFDVQIPAINKHLKNIFDSWELDSNVVISKMEITNQHWAINWKFQTNNVQFYNLDAVISVWYRVNSIKATHFRIRATKILREYIQKWFAMDDERLKQWTTAFWVDYFHELLERIHSIRTSERRIRQQITDIFAECSIDYDKCSSTTQEFYATIQNKFHYAIVWKTATEIIYEKANSNNENMWLTTRKFAPDGRILKSDTTIAKNYLSEKEIKQLERTVSWYFDYIEDLVIREHVFTMEDFAKSVNEFLEFRKYKILDNNWAISHSQAEEKAFSEYEKFNKTQKIWSDFDELIAKIKK